MDFTLWNNKGILSFLILELLFLVVLFFCLKPNQKIFGQVLVRFLVRSIFPNNTSFIDIPNQPNQKNAKNFSFVLSCVHSLVPRQYIQKNWLGWLGFLKKWLFIGIYRPNQNSSFLVRFCYIWLTQLKKRHFSAKIKLCTQLNAF